MTTHESHTPKRHRDSWRTPPSVFEQLNAEFNFVLDVAASDENALCPFYFTEKTDGLAQDWPRAAVWCNPPYSDPKPWVDKAAESAKAGTITAMLLNFDSSVRWFGEVWRSSCEVRLIRGRLSFIDGDGVSRGVITNLKRSSYGAAFVKALPQCLST